MRTWLVERLTNVVDYLLPIVVLVAVVLLVAYFAGPELVGRLQSAR